MTGLPGDENWSGSIQPPQWTPPATVVIPAAFAEQDPRTYWLHIDRHPFVFPIVKWVVFTVGTALQGVILLVGLTVPWGYFDKQYLGPVGYFVVFMLFFWAIRDHAIEHHFTSGFDNPSQAFYHMLRRSVRCGLALLVGYLAHAEAIRRGLDGPKLLGVWVGAVAVVYLLLSPLFRAAKRGPLRWLFPPRRAPLRSRPALWRDPAELRRPPG